MKTKTILVDGQWNLKRNFHKRKHVSAKGELCGGTFGFLDSLKTVINKTLPDRVVVLWDGFHSGYYRYQIYPPYKAKRKDYWAVEDRIIQSGGFPESEKDKERAEILRQKIKVQNYLEDIFVRQAEVDYVEGDDLIAYYILNSTIPNEEIYIYSKDGDFKHLISENVSIINPDSYNIITINNFEEKFGHTVDNELLFKCFEGDDSDEITGVKGITRNNLMKYFPEMAKEKYLYSRLVEEATEKKKNHKIKFYDKIIEAEDILYRNAKLMNLKKPFIDENAKIEMEKVIHGYLDSDRSIDTAMKSFVKDGFSPLLYNISVGDFFGPYYRLMAKEKEFAKKMKM
jgi:5'-3' exonuclease